MNSIPDNPFLNRAMIKTEAAFIGREAEIRDIMARVRSQESVSVVGERRIGKSSLLYHLFLTGPRRLGDLEKSRFQFVYLDLTDIRCASVTDFCQQVLRELGKPPQSPPNASAKDALIELNNYLDARLQQKLPFSVLFLDEFEKCTQSGHFDDDFFNNLRHLISTHKLSLVTASQQTLKALTEKGGLTSPFWNVFLNQPLSEFSTEEVALFIEHFWLQQLTPTETELAFLVSYCGTHPLYLQVVSTWVLRNRELQFNEIALKAEIDRELAGYFRDRPEKVTKWLKREIPKNFKRAVWTAEEIGKVIKAISPLALNFKAENK